MKKTIQNATGFQVMDSDINPEYFSPEELIKAQFQKNLIDAYNQAIIDLATIKNTASPTSAELIWAVKKEAEILEIMLTFIKNDIIH